MAGGDTDPQCDLPLNGHLADEELSCDFRSESHVLTGPNIKCKKSFITRSYGRFSHGKLLYRCTAIKTGRTGSRRAADRKRLAHLPSSLSRTVGLEPAQPMWIITRKNGAMYPDSRRYRESFPLAL
jgi:hypothetical protein